MKLPRNNIDPLQKQTNKQTNKQTHTHTHTHTQTNTHTHTHTQSCFKGGKDRLQLLFKSN